MWQATFTESNFQDGRYDITVVYSKDTRSFQETYPLSSVSSDTWLSDTVKNRIAQLEMLDAYAATLSPGGVVLSSVQVSEIQSQVFALLNPVVSDPASTITIQ